VVENSDEFWGKNNLCSKAHLFSKTKPFKYELCIFLNFRKITKLEAENFFELHIENRIEKK